MPAHLSVRLVGWSAASLGLIPLLWLAGTGKHDRAWWWLAGAFGISFLADLSAQWVNPFTVSIVYPVSQSALIVAVLAERRDAFAFLGLVCLTGLATILSRGVDGPDVLLRTVAWGGVTVVAGSRPELGKLRMALVTAFGLGWVAWLGYTAVPGWTSWGIYQVVRALGIGLFCWASLHPTPRLRLA